MKVLISEETRIRKRISKYSTKLLRAELAKSPTLINLIQSFINGLENQLN